ncbi:hypothetical protein HPULCUR_008717 [Helicostylum pulchrum]|uniref:Uncharacterized protein n=1 Tax=Helicostylum pulchrum TaxID=562976 RepID=A0ABP9Y9F0_9FUNG
MRFDMGNVYDFYQHGDCAVIYIGEKEIVVEMCSDSVQYSSVKTLKKEACIVYNKQKKTVESWGYIYFTDEDQKYICIRDFREKLYQLFQRDQSTWDEDDVFLVQAISELVRLTVQEARTLPGIIIEHTDALHYVFVVPSHWQESVARNLVRSVFSQACLISAQDHEDRVLLCPEVESIYYFLERTKKSLFQTGQRTILSRLTVVEQDTVSVKLDLVSTMDTLFDSENSLMVPKVLRSVDLSFTCQGIKNCIKEFFRRLLFDGTDSVEQDALLDDIVEFKFNIILLKANTLDKFQYDDNPSYENYVYGRSELSEIQKAIVRSIRPIDLCDSMRKTLFVNMTDLLSNHSEKGYKLLVLQDSYSYRVPYGYFPLERRLSLLGWINIMIEYNRRSLSSTTIAIEPSVDIDPISLNCIVSGASFAAMEIVKNSSKYRKPLIIESKDVSTSSSIFLNSGPDAIVNIDLSYKSTVLSYSLMDDDGVIEKIFDHNYFTNNKALVSLSSFFNVSEEITLNVEEQFIPFADKYFSDVGCLSQNKKEILPQFKKILDSTLSTKQVLVSTTQLKYFNAFMFMYLVYIRELLLSKLPSQVKPDDININVGYVVSTEKMLLEETIGSTKKLKDILFASGLVQKNDSRKLIITTQEEELVPKIQKSFELQFPVKSYFVVAQLYQDYIQLTLRQFVTKSKEEEQESIVVQEVVVPILDIYNNLSLKMWKKLTKDQDLIQLCHLHDQSNENQISKMLSSNIRTGFSSNFKLYISSKIFAQGSDLESSDDNVIPLSAFCNCRVRLTIIPDLPQLLLRPVIKQRSLLYKTFQVGRLHQVYTGSYVVSVTFTGLQKLKFSFSDRKMDEETIDKIELVDDLKYEKFDLRGAQFESIFDSSLYFKQKEYKAHRNIPMVISVESRDYSSSVKFFIKVNGQVLNQTVSPEITEPLTLMRF